MALKSDYLRKKFDVLKSTSPYYSNDPSNENRNTINRDIGETGAMWDMGLHGTSQF
jgi:hypothetical protein